MKMTSSKAKTITVYWFRNALRLHDNPSLLHACGNVSSSVSDSTLKSNSLLCPIYVIDPRCPFAQTKGRRVGANRANFILESLQDLNGKLNALDSKLLVLKGDPRNVLPSVFAQLKKVYDVKGSNTEFHLIYEKESAQPIRELDREVLKNMDDSINVKSFDTHSLFEMEHYVAKCKGGVAPSTLTGFRKIFNGMGDVSEEVDPITWCPELPDVNNLSEFSFETTDVSYSVPSLQMLGYSEEESKIWREDTDCAFIGGEDEGLKLLEKMKRRPSWVAEFEKPKTKPNALSPDTTALSPCKYHSKIISSHQ